MKNYPAEYYAVEKNPVNLVGYTAALVLMAAGAAQIAMISMAILRGDESLKVLRNRTKFDLVLGPGVIVCGGVAAYGYLKEAGVVY